MWRGSSLRRLSLCGGKGVFLNSRRNFSSILFSQQKVIDGLSPDLLISISMGFHQSASSHSDLIAKLKANNFIHSALLSQVWSELDRALFVPISIISNRSKEETANRKSSSSSSPEVHEERKRSWIYEDKPLPVDELGGPIDCSAPHMYAICLEALLPAIRSGALILDIGSGSGYLTTILAGLVHQTEKAEKSPSSNNHNNHHGFVIGVELSQRLVTQAQSALLRASVELASRVHFLQGNFFRWESVRQDIEEVYRQFAHDDTPLQFDVIHVGAALNQLPLHLIELLAPGGRLLVPVCKQGSLEQELILVEKDSQGKATSKVIMTCMYSDMWTEEPPVKPLLFDILEKSPEHELNELKQQMDAASAALAEWQTDFKKEHQKKPSLDDFQTNPLFLTFTEAKKAYDRKKRKLGQ